MLASAKFWSFHCKTCTSEYSKWLPPVAFSQLLSAPNSFPVLGELTLLPQPPSWFNGDPTSKGEGTGDCPLTQFAGSTCAKRNVCLMDAFNWIIISTFHMSHKFARFLFLSLTIVIFSMYTQVIWVQFCVLYIRLLVCCKTLNVGVPFISWAKQNHEIKGRQYELYSNSNLQPWRW